MVLLDIVVDEDGQARVELFAHVVTTENDKSYATCDVMVSEKKRGDEEQARTSATLRTV